MNSEDSESLVLAFVSRMLEEGEQQASIMIDKQKIEIAGAATYGPYSPGVKSYGILWLSGQIAPEAGDFSEQVQGALDKIDALLEAANLSKHDVTFAQILLTDMDNFSALNEVYGAWVEDVEVKPARAAFAAAALPANALVEIVVQAIDTSCDCGDPNCGLDEAEHHHHEDSDEHSREHPDGCCGSGCDDCCAN